MPLLLRSTIVAVAALAALALAGCQGQQKQYDAATHEAFIEVCGEGKNAPDQSTCECYYSQLTDSLSFDRFSELDRSMKNDPEFTPDEVVKAVSACSNEGSSSSSSESSSDSSSDSGSSSPDDRSDASDRSDTVNSDASDASDVSDQNTSGDAVTRSPGGLFGNLPGRS